MTANTEPTKGWRGGPQQSSAKLPAFLTRDRPSSLLMLLGPGEKHKKSRKSPKRSFFLKKKKVRNQGQGPMRVIDH